MNHPNVLKLFGAGREKFILGGQEQGKRNYVVSELCPKGELFDFIQKSNGGLSENLARLVFK